MAARSLPVVVLLLCAVTACFGQDGAPMGSQAPAPGRDAPAVSEDLDADAPLLDVALQIARADHPDLDADAVRAEIRRLADSWRALVADETDPVARADAFATVLFEQERFTSVADLDSPENLHIDSVLEHRRGYCLSLSVVALAMAEEVGAPLHGVAAPNHFYVRWDDGTVRHALELTRNGEPLDDEELQARIADFLLDDTIYFRNLTRREVVGVLMHNRGFVALVDGRSDRARADLEAAAALVPGLPEVHRNLGVLHGEAEEWADGIEELERALMLYPGDVDALVNLALCRRGAGDRERALEDVEIALLLDPSHGRAAQLMHAWEHDEAFVASGARRLDDPPPGARPGLPGTFHRGRRLNRPTETRVARELEFDWGRKRPLRAVSDDDFSVRWEGWLKIPASGLHTWFVVANDGVRIDIGGTRIIDQWSDVGYSSWTGTADVTLPAGWHPLRIDYFDSSGNARLVCLVSRDGDEFPLDLSEHLFHQP